MIYRIAYLLMPVGWMEKQGWRGTLARRVFREHVYRRVE